MYSFGGFSIELKSSMSLVSVTLLTFAAFLIIFSASSYLFLLINHLADSGINLLNIKEKLIYCLLLHWISVMDLLLRNGNF